MAVRPTLSSFESVFERIESLSRSDRLASPVEQSSRGQRLGHGLVDLKLLLNGQPVNPFDHRLHRNLLRHDRARVREGEQAHHNHAIDAVHNTPMSREFGREILDLERSLEARSEEPPEWPDRRREDGEGGAVELHRRQTQTANELNLGKKLAPPNYP